MGVPTIPNSFSAGTNIKSGEVNSDFQALLNAITDGTADLTFGSINCPSVKSNLIPNATNTYSLGNGSAYYSNVYGTSVFTNGGKFASGIIEFAGAKNPGWVSNIGMSYSAGTFSILGSDASTALSSSNPGYVSLPSVSNAGKTVTLKVTSNVTFIDDAGSSDIVGEQFGVTTGVAWASARPFYLYAINGDDTDSGLRFAISPNPCAVQTPATANIGWKGNPAATPSDNGFFFLTSTDPSTTHDAVPCVRIGGLRMVMSTSDDWTVQTLSYASGDGIRLDPMTGVQFIFPTAQNGAASGSHLSVITAGNPPSWATAANIGYYYYVDLNGTCRFVYTTSGAGNCTNGTGGPNDLYLAVPYKFNNNIYSTTSFGSFIPALGRIRIGAGNNQACLGVITPTGTTQIGLGYASGSSILSLQNSDFSNAADDINVNLEYQAFNPTST